MFQTATPCPELALWHWHGLFERSLLFRLGSPDTTWPRYQKMALDLSGSFLFIYDIKKQVSLRLYVHTAL